MQPVEGVPTPERVNDMLTVCGKLTFSNHLVNKFCEIRPVEVVLGRDGNAQHRGRLVPGPAKHLVLVVVPLPSRPRLVPARPKVCTRYVREPLRFQKQSNLGAAERPCKNSAVFENASIQNPCLGRLVLGPAKHLVLVVVPLPSRPSLVPARL